MMMMMRICAGCRRRGSSHVVHSSLTTMPLLLLLLFSSSFSNPWTSTTTTAIVAVRAWVVVAPAASVRPPSRTATAAASSTIVTGERETTTGDGEDDDEEEETTTAALVPPRSLQELLRMDDGKSTTTDLYDRNVQNTYGRFPLVMKSGRGCRLRAMADDENVDGGDAPTEYIDFAAGIATCILGHNNTELNDAVYGQMREVHHVSNLYYIPSQALLAEWLTRNSCADKVFFCNSGAEANEAAIKCARKHAWKRGITKPVIITAIDSFHGRTLAAITATGQPKYHEGFTYDGVMVPGFVYVPYNDVDALRVVVDEIQNGDDGRGIAAIMMEPLQGEGGVVPGDATFFRSVREMCDDANALMICDEVQIGMGRSGKLWGHEHFPADVLPDIFTSAKALGGGIPIGAMLARGDAANVFGPGDHASTYGGNPLACSAGLAIARYMCEHDLVRNAEERGRQLARALNDLALEYPRLLGEVRGWGLLLGIPITSSSVTAGYVVNRALERGLLLVPAGQNVVRFVPPLIVDERDIQDAMDLFRGVVEDIAKEMQEKDKN